MCKRKENPIAFFDSGVGGISVLKEAVKIMPCEDYIYFGDSKNAPYGVKTTEEVKKLTESNIEFLIEKGAKAVVIACNTATSAAAEYLRGKYKEYPIIGVEPALKPAALNNEGKKVLVMATPMTLTQKKFRSLMNRYADIAKIVPVPCGGLMEFVEQGILDGEELDDFLGQILTKELCEGVEAVVLGCTHYPFIKKGIIKAVGHEIEIYDGGMGTAKHLRNRLMKNGLLTERTERGKVEVINSSNSEEMTKLSKRLINAEDIENGRK